MKKLFIMGLAAMGLALTACNSDETVEMAKGNAIGFKTFVNNSTRVATDATTTNLESFKVWGKMKKDDQTGTPFDGVVVSKDAQKGWTYTTPVYWENGYSYSFVALAPVDAFTMTDPNAYQNYGSIAFNNDAKAGETDLVYAAKDCGEVTVAANECPKAVDLTFNHMLARVRFQFKNAMDDGSTLTVTDVKITNAYKSGTAELKAVFNDLKWVPDEATGELAFDNATTTKFAQNASCVTGHKYMIPAPQAKVYKVTFKVTRKHNGVTDEYTHTVDLPETAMQPGKSYQFTAEFTHENINPDQVLCPITFTATVDPWVDVVPDQKFNLK
ncbi:fimbrillin family protein [uncultured Prevotella sp.]|uniref:fimbrillin family protein n=1 Tax=uncultured Prevotella sp. TaxID=159272 RepID=UPI0026126DDA|nr:fimbrillin family protein [uncultured Prevotella sp.]